MPGASDYDEPRKQNQPAVESKQGDYTGRTKAAGTKLGNQRRRTSDSEAFLQQLVDAGDGFPSAKVVVDEVALAVEGLTFGTYFPSDELCVELGHEMKNLAKAARAEGTTLEIDFNVYTFQSDSGWHGERHSCAVLRKLGLAKLNCKLPGKEDISKAFIYVIHFESDWIRAIIDRAPVRSTAEVQD